MSSVTYTDEAIHAAALTLARDAGYKLVSELPEWARPWFSRPGSPDLVRGVESGWPEVNTLATYVQRVIRTIEALGAPA